MEAIAFIKETFVVVRAPQRDYSLAFCGNRKSAGIVGTECEEGASQRGNATQGSRAQERTEGFAPGVMRTYQGVYSVMVWLIFYLVNLLSALCKRTVKKNRTNSVHYPWWRLRRCYLRNTGQSRD